MDSTTKFFKSYKRQRRVLLAEERFNAGMYYTDAPLASGFVKLMVNYDLKDKGASLTPRPSLKPQSLALHRKLQELTTLSYTPYADDLMLAAGRQCTEVNNKTYQQIIIGQPELEAVPNTNLYRGGLRVATAYAPSDYYESEAGLHEAFSPFISAQDLVIKSLTTDGTYTSFKRPKAVRIHNLPLTGSPYIAQHVGTFAYNNNYYFFRHSDTNPSELVRTKFCKELEGEPGARYDSEVVTPRQVTPKEAVMWGYNMLQQNPYSFTDQAGVGTIQFLGILLYDSTGTLTMTPLMNQDLTFRCFYSAPEGNTYEFKWEWKEPAADTWNDLSTETLSMSGLPAVKVTFASPSEQVLVRITATKQGVDFPEQVLTVGFNFDPTQYGSTANIKPVNYDIAKASGLSFWDHRLVVYGLQEDPTVLLMSDVNDPSYFPYPQNADLFEEPIRHVLPFLDNLLVFTSTQLHLITPDLETGSWITTMIQGGLDIQEWDIHLIKVIKNMVFFKSGNYYYMVVPRMATGALTIAPISKNMESFFDHFRKSVLEIMHTLYNYEDTLELVHYYNYLDYEDVHNVYVFKTNSGLYVNLMLLYNTVARTWRIYIHESQHIYVPFKDDATKKGTLMGLVPLYQRIVYTDGSYDIGITTGIQFLQYDSQNCMDLYIPQNLRILPAVGEYEDESLDIQTSFDQINQFKNYQILDTGYREQDTDFKKRYRELQIKLNNISLQNLYFYTDFYIDGESRRRMYRYKTVHNIDPTDPDYGLLSIEREFVDPTIVPGATVLARDETDLNAWRLDVSGFPQLNLWKVRIPVSGKGYAPRLYLVSRNDLPYDLFSLGWVYRPLYAR